MRSGTCASLIRATRAATRAPPSSRSIHSWCAPSRRRSGDRRRRCSWRPTSWRWRPSGRSRAVLQARLARAGPPARAPRAAAAVGVPGRALLRGALRREPVPAVRRGRLLRRTHGPLGVGRRLRRGRGGHAQCRHPAGGAAADALVGRRPAAEWPVAAVGAARRGRLCALPRAGGGRCAALPRRPGRLVARVRLSAERSLGRPQRRLGRAATARLGPEGDRCTSRSRRATRTGSPRST